jgi:hypothetical protein
VGPTKRRTQFLHIPNQTARVHRLWLQCLPPGKGQQVIRQGCRTFHALADVFRKAPCLGCLSVFQPASHQFQAAANLALSAGQE